MPVCQLEPVADSSLTSAQTYDMEAGCIINVYLCYMVAGLGSFCKKENRKLELAGPYSSFVPVSGALFPNNYRNISLQCKQCEYVKSIMYTSARRKIPSNSRQHTYSLPTFLNNCCCTQSSHTVSCICNSFVLRCEGVSISLMAKYCFLIRRSTNV